MIPPRTLVKALYDQWEECGYPDLQLRHLIQRMRECGKMLEQEWVLC